MKKYCFLFFIWLTSLNIFAQYKFNKELSARSDSIPQFSWLRGVAADTLGNIYLAEYSRKTVVVIDSSGKVLNEFSTKQTNLLYNITLDDSLNIYVATLGSGIVKMSKSGKILRNISNNRYVIGLAVDHKGYIYVLSDNSYSVLKYDKNGILVNTFGGSGTGNGKFTGALKSATIDDKNNVYITAGSTIHKFDSSGVFVKKFGGYGGLDGQFYRAEGIAFNKNNGHLVVCDYSLNRIQIFDTAGTYIGKFGLPGLTDGKFYYPTNVALDKNNNIFIVDDKPGSTNVKGLQKFNYSGNFIKRFGVNGNEDSLFYLPIDIKIDSKGNFNVLDIGKNAVIQFDSNWKYIRRIGYFSELGIDSSFQMLNQIRIDHKDYLYVWDNINRIQRFKPNGNFDSSWVMPITDTVFAVSSLAAYDEFGNKYISKYNTIEKYTNNVLISNFGKEGIEVGNFNSCQGICIGKNKKLYVTDSQNNRVQIFNPCPRIKVNVDSINILNSEYTYNYGSTQPSVVIEKEFIIRNVGNTDLTISAIDIMNANPSFTIDDLNTNYTIPHDNFTKVIFKFNPVGLGNKTDTISISSNSIVDTTFKMGVFGTTKGILNVKINNIQYNYGGSLFIEKDESGPNVNVIVTVENLGFEELIIDSIVCIVGCDYFTIIKNAFDFNISAFNSSDFRIDYSLPTSTPHGAQIVIYSKDQRQPVFLIYPIGRIVSAIEDKVLLLEHINLFPNPTSQNINIHSTYNIEKINVIDVLGNEVLNIESNGNTQLDISSLPKGLYNFVITTDKGIGSKKVSVQ